MLRVQFRLWCRLHRRVSAVLMRQETGRNASSRPQTVQSVLRLLWNRLTSQTTAEGRGDGGGEGGGAGGSDGGGGSGGDGGGGVAVIRIPHRPKLYHVAM